MKNILLKTSNVIASLVLLIGIMTVGSLYAQTTVTGVVTGGGATLPGVNIIIKGTTNGTVTDLDGKYSISAKPDDVLTISFIGFLEQSVPVNGRTTININLVEDLKTLEEVVVIGYGEQDKREVTGSVASIKSEDIMRNAASDLGAALQGQMAGVNIQQSGTPGESAIVNIRGISSIDGSQPLYVVDGVPYSGDPQIPPAEIASVDILKDGASAAIYGTRASSGVIIITTKQGKPGKVKVAYDGWYGIQNITSGIALGSTRDQIKIQNLVNKTDKNNNNKLDFLSFNPNALKYNTDWSKFLIRDNQPITNHSLRVSGGSDNLLYNVTSTYFQQLGAFDKADFRRGNIRANATLKTEKLTTNVIIGISRGKKSNAPWGLQYRAIRMAPYTDPIGEPQKHTISDPTNNEFVGGFLGAFNNDSNEDQNGLNGNMRLTYKPIDGLSIMGLFGGSRSQNVITGFQPEISTFNKDEDGEITENIVRGEAILSENTWTFTNTVAEVTVNWKKQFGKHSVELLAGNSWNSNYSRNFQLTATGVSNAKRTFQTATDSGNPKSTEGTTNIIGIIGRVLYNYDSKYLFSASIRRDGSSNFSEENRWGTFPGVSAGWNIHEEPFFQPITSIVSKVKLKASYGQTGNQNIPRYADEALIDNNVNYVFNNAYAKGKINGGFASPGLKWETNVDYNIGLETEYFNGRLGLGFDVYKRDKRDMLLSVETTSSAGATSDGGRNRIIRNVGNLENRGFELTGRYDNSIGKLKMRNNLTLSFNKNKIVKLAESLKNLPGGLPFIGIPTTSQQTTTYITPGFTAGSFFLIPTDGIIRTEEEAAEYKKLDNNSQIGDLRYIDVNQDGQISDADRTYQGSGTPKMTAGYALDLTYNNFNLVVQTYLSYGAKVYNGARAYAYSIKRSADQVYAWSEFNPNSNIPGVRQAGGNEHNNTRTWSDYFLEDATYVRIQNITLGYNIPKTILDRLRLTRMKVYLQATNPFTFTKYSGFDPEVGSRNVLNIGVDRANQPVSRQFRFGLQLAF